MTKAASPSKRDKVNEEEEVEAPKSSQPKRKRKTKSEPKEDCKSARTSRQSKGGKKKEPKEIDETTHIAEQESIIEWLQSNNLDYKADYDELKPAARKAFGGTEFFSLNPYWTRFTAGLTLWMNGAKQDVAHFSFEKTARGMLLSVACAYYLATQSGK